ncbi:hypothetical protein WNY37_04560 [Henriciella sp. AS95]|uniref:c-type cytochrome n=1 Tax=Henriciella sp. AS95 TaxID=3135782 RepID=UPI00317676C3
MTERARARVITGLVAGLALAACSQSAAPGADSGGASGSDLNSDLSSAAALALSCTGCHSDAGEGIADIDDYTSDAIKTALDRYKLEVDGTTVMHRLIRGYSDDQIQAVSDYLGAETSK